jgi:hypothetical protein
MSDKRITKRELPPVAIREPIKARSEYVLRATHVFVILVCAIIILVNVADYTGKATARTTVNISQVINQSCDFTLQPGLNVVSFNCVSTATNVSEVLGLTDISAINVVYEYNNQQDDLWYVYNPNLPSWVVNDLDTFSRLKGYLFYMNGSTLVQYDGIIASFSTIPLLPGNNLAGFPSIVNRTLPEGLTTINDTYLRVRTWNGTDWIEFNATNSTGLDNLTINEGYWITQSAADNWEVDYNGP